MPSQNPQDHWRLRDGTSQTQRRQAALEPSYAPVDERSLKDLLAFVQAYAKELHYFSAHDEATGDWSAFLPKGLDLDAVEAFMQDPEKATPKTAEHLSRPHVALLLAFLQLLGEAKSHLNTLTGRHLEYYYEHVLRMLPKPGSPNHVHVLVDLATDEPVALPAGTLLNAGSDSAGKHLAYSTDRMLMVSTAQVGQLRSLYVDKRRTTIRSAREQHHGDPIAALMAMLQIALGDPGPGDPLPPYPPDGAHLDSATLERLHRMVRFIPEHLHLTFHQFRLLMAFKQQSHASGVDWNQICQILQEVSQAFNQNPNVTLASADPKAFDQDLQAVFGNVQFTQLPDGIDSLDSLYTSMQRLEQYFFMPSESFDYIMTMAQNPATAAADWRQVYNLLGQAYAEKVFTKHLQQVRESKGVDAMLAAALGEATTASKDEKTLLNQLLKDASTTDANFVRDKVQLALSGTVTDADWQWVYRIVEAAGRPDRHLPTPVAMKSEWLNLYPADDATAVVVPHHAGSDKTPHWRTFGEAQLNVPPNSPPPTTFGWAITSPFLALSEGERTLTVTLGFEAEGFDTQTIDALIQTQPPSAQPFTVQISTVKGWIEPDTLTMRVGNYASLSGLNSADNSLQALQLTAKFSVAVDAIAPLPSKLALFETPWPLLKLMLRQIWQPNPGPAGAAPDPKAGRYICHYEPFQPLVLADVYLKAEVTGLVPLQLQNDDASLNPAKPFEPFGPTPAVGSRLYLGHPELATQPLDSLKFHVQWMGVPEHLQAYYTHYDDLDFSNQENLIFTTRVSLVDKRRDIDLLPSNPLFEKSNAQSEHTIKVSDVPAALKTGAANSNWPDYVYGPGEAFDPKDTLLQWPRYLQWELNAPDFQHQVYPSVVTREANDMSAAIANQHAASPKAKVTVNAADYQVNPPYTPTLKHLTIDYTASLNVALDSLTADDPVARIVHFQPFGYCDILPEAGSDPERYPFLPQYENQGELFIGLDKVAAPQPLSILFGMVEGSANADIKPEPVQWSYLDGNRWVRLPDHHIMLDTTRGLINSGIMTFDLEAVQPSTLFPTELYWLRASVAEHTNSLCDAIGIHTQAVSATFTDQDNAPDHLSQPLAANKIKALVEPNAAIRGIRQPYSSFGGAMPEQSSSFYTRVSERLRHKHRGVNLWDYEHLILAHFPELYKVKCLLADPVSQQSVPGLVEIVVVPNARGKVPFNPFGPKAPTNLLADVESFLADKTPAFATIKVKNPHYVPVRVQFSVKFFPNYDAGEYLRRLNDELNHFLSPWAYDASVDIVIGGRIYANIIVNFIEERPYVDYVADIKLFSSEDSGRTFTMAQPSGEAGYWVETNRSDGVLVAAHRHHITLLSSDQEDVDDHSGMNYMVIESNFVVG